MAKKEKPRCAGCGQTTNTLCLKPVRVCTDCDVREGKFYPMYNGLTRLDIKQTYVYEGTDGTIRKVFKVVPKEGYPGKPKDALDDMVMFSHLGGEKDGKEEVCWMIEFLEWVVKRLPREPIPNNNTISTYYHCGLCVNEWKQGAAPGTSPSEYSRTQIGNTPWGLQVWCARHEVNVCHIDFEGIKHTANMTRHDESLK